MAQTSSATDATRRGGAAHSASSRANPSFRAGSTSSDSQVLCRWGAAQATPSAALLDPLTHAAKWCSIEPCCDWRRPLAGGVACRPHSRYRAGIPWWIQLSCSCRNPPSGSPHLPAGGSAPIQAGQSSSGTAAPGPHGHRQTQCLGTLPCVGSDSTAGGVLPLPRAGADAHHSRGRRWPVHGQVVLWMLDDDDTACAC